MTRTKRMLSSCSCSIPGSHNICSDIGMPAHPYRNTPAHCSRSSDTCVLHSNSLRPRPPCTLHGPLYANGRYAYSSIGCRAWPYGCRIRRSAFGFLQMRRPAAASPLPRSSARVGLFFSSGASRGAEHGRCILPSDVPHLLYRSLYRICLLSSEFLVCSAHWYFGGCCRAAAGPAGRIGFWIF